MDILSGSVINSVCNKYFGIVLIFESPIIKIFSLDRQLFIKGLKIIIANKIINFA